MKIWVIHTDWVTDGDCGGDVTLYSDEAKARVEYNKAIVDELASYGDSIDKYIIENDGYSFRIFEEYNYCHNHSEIILESKTVID